MNRSVEKYLKSFGIAVLAIVLVSIASGYAPLLGLRAQAQAQQYVKFTFSSTNFNPAKVIRIQIETNIFPSPPSSIKLQVLNVTRSTDPEYNRPVDLVWMNGTQSTGPGANFTAALISSVGGVAIYVAYLGGNSTNLAQNPANPADLIGANTTNPGIIFSSIANITNTSAGNIVNQGTKYVIQIVGLGNVGRSDTYGLTLIYDTVSPVVIVSPKQVGYRRNALINITLIDQDLNKDPTSVDTIPRAFLDNISVTISVAIAANFSTISKTVNASNIVIPSLTSVNESDVNTGTFTLWASVLTINQAIGYNITANDTVTLTFRVKGANLQGGFPGPTTGGSDSFVAVYRTPSISISTTSKAVVISITSPDDNVNPSAKDTLDPGDYPGTSPANLSITLTAGGTTLASFSDYASNLATETDVNTGVFIWSLSLGWNTTASISSSNIFLPTGVDGPFIITVRYFTNATNRTLALGTTGYDVNVVGRGNYTPNLASLALVSASTKLWVIDVTDPDLNNNAKVQERLIPFNVTTLPGNADFWLNRTVGSTWATLARLTILDMSGNVVTTTATDPSSVILSFVEQGTDSSTFRITINASLLNIVPGQSYTVKYIDLTGFTTSDGVVTLTIPVAPKVISLDRSTYPVNRDKGVTVYISYSNNDLNVNPLAPDIALVNVTVMAGATVLYSANLTQLVETDPITGDLAPNSGFFTGSITIPASVFDNVKVIGSTLVVMDAANANINKTAVFKPSGASISVNGSTSITVKFGDVVDVVVVYPDGNADSKAKDSIVVTVSSVLLPAFNLTLTETDVNTGVFEGTIRISWDDARLAGFVRAGDTINIVFYDRTPVIDPTQFTSWPAPVPYVANVKVRTTTGVLTVSTALSGAIMPFENFTVFVADPDLNKYVNQVDTPSITEGRVEISIDGVPKVTLALTETGANTGVFTTGTLNLTYLLNLAGIAVPADPRGRAAALAAYVGRSVAIAYIDMANDAGVSQVISQIFRIKAFNAVITTTPDTFVNVNGTITITVNNLDVANTTEPTYKQVTVKSNSSPTGVVFNMTEISPGVFSVNVTVRDPSDPAAFAPGAIPAKAGETIRIEYVDPITENGGANVLFTKTLSVGAPAVGKPIQVPSGGITTADPQTGSPVTPKVNQTVLVTANMTNLGASSQSMVVFITIYQNISGQLVPITQLVGITTLAPGQSFVLGLPWIPRVAGTYVIEVIVIKSFTDRTPLADPSRATVVVSPP